MSIVQAFRQSFSLKVSATLAAVLLLLILATAALITVRQTRQLEELTLEKSRVAAAIGARQYGDVLDSAIDSGTVSVADAFDRSYVEIKGYDWGTGPPKYHTRYDFVTDRAVLVFQDKFLEHGDFLFAVGVDENGYLPTHNTVFQKPLTGSPDKDLTGNRTKRLFNDPVGLAAARNLEPSLVQVYKRDTGETLWDISSPILVKGRHWGAFRVGVSMDRILSRQKDLVASLAAIFAIFGAITTGSLFLLINRAVRPVVVLTAAAHQISLGEALDQPLRSDSPDEFGRLTKAIDRLRVSMKGALSRLGE